MRASVLLNAEVCAAHPAIIEEGNKRSWEWLGHGMNNNTRMNSYGAKKQRKVIRKVRDIIAHATGKAPKGWLGPGLSETYDTPDYLAAEGFEYLCDWGHDDQPTPMRVEAGRMITVPYQQGINDISMFVHANHTPGGVLPDRLRPSSTPSTGRARTAAGSWPSRCTRTLPPCPSASAPWTARWTTSAPTTASGRPPRVRSPTGTISTTTRLRASLKD